jgi:hypothetical protein
MRNGTREARRGVGVARGAKLADGYGEASENKEADKRLSDYRQYRGLGRAIVKQCARRGRRSEGPRGYVKHSKGDDDADRDNSDNEQECNGNPQIKEKSSAPPHPDGRNGLEGPSDAADGRREPTPNAAIGRRVTRRDK